MACRAAPGPKAMERRRRGGKGRRRQGEEGKEKLPITFYGLISGVMQSHFLYALLVKAITKVHPGSRGGLT